jgi:hypothetical protein
MRSHEAREMRSPGLRLVLVLGGLVASIGWAQKVQGGPELWIELPVKKTGPGRVEVAYSIVAGQSHSYTMSSKAKPPFGELVSWEFVIEAAVNRIAADRVRAVVYMPGCKTISLDVAFHGKTLGRYVQCARLSDLTLKGQLVDASVAKTGSLKVDVTYSANWASNFLGVDELAIFYVASTSVSKNGSFSVELPILALDSAEESAKGEDRGELLFTLRNGVTGGTVGTLQADQFATPSGGLELRTEYPGLRFALEQ